MRKTLICKKKQAQKRYTTFPIKNTETGKYIEKKNK